MKAAMFACMLGMTMLLAAVAGANSKTAGSKDAAAGAPAAAGNAAQDDGMRAEGEKRFRSNCARCHAAPPKFSPRVMATIVRHMRVRANITDEDMRLVLRYMTE